MYKRNKRSGIEVQYDLLRVISEEPGVKKTKLMNRVNLNYDVFAKHLDLVMERGYVSYDGYGYTLTDKGRTRLERLEDMVRKYREYRELLERSRALKREIERLFTREMDEFPLDVRYLKGYS